jgi:hypothetical protein
MSFLDGTEVKSKTRQRNQDMLASIEHPPAFLNRAIPIPRHAHFFFNAV